MLNLSDKELDRFSREAAQEYEPGEVLGPQNWERLEVRLDREFGRSGWNFWRHVRRYPMYYAPALVVLLGVGYLFTRPGVSSGSSPGKTAAAGTEKTTTAGTEKTTNTQNPTSTHSLNSTPDASTVVLPATPNGSDGADGARAGGSPAGSGAVSGGAASAPAGSVGAGLNGATGAGNEAAGAAGNGARVGNETARGAGKPVGVGVNAAGSGVSASSASGSGARPKGSGRNVTGPLADAGLRPAGRRGRGRTGHNAAGGDAGDNNILAVNSGAAGSGSTANQQRELSLSSVQTAHSLGKRGRVSDSALRAFTLKSKPPTLKPTRHLEIRRNWQFGLSIAPDFTSVNSLSSDRPGSSFGLTVDYMFAPHWYLSSGILATRKNYAARNDNYAPPPNFYQRNNVMGDKINFAKGSFYMMEIPLNLRYDFSVSGNTLFFISGGASTYLLTSEDVNLYYQRFGFLWCQPVNHPSSKSTYLFSTINLSAGVETGLSNSLSLLVAPYVKLPTTKMGIGQVDMNSVGITFALKFAPVTGYKRK